MKKTTFKRVISTLFFLASFTCSFADDYIQIRPQEWSVDTVPYSFYADIQRTFPNTFNKTEFLDPNPYKITVESQFPCYIYIFRKENAASFSESYPCDTLRVNGGIAYSINDPGNASIQGMFDPQPIVIENLIYKSVIYTDIPCTDDYTFVILTMDNYNTSSNLCKLTVFDDNNKYTIFTYKTNAYKKSQCTLEYYHSNTSNNGSGFYNSFTHNSNADAQLCLIGSNNVVSAHSDSNHRPTLLDWGTEARVQIYMSTNDTIHALVFSADSVDSITTDLYCDCKKRIYSTNSVFPLLANVDDALITHKACGEYNCGAWALGEWRWGKFPNNTSTSKSYEFEGGYPMYASGFENWWYGYGFTFVGATEENSEMDAWAYNDHYTHVSIRSGLNGLSWGYGWESKIGSEERIMHPRYALTNTISGNLPYGEVFEHFIRRTDFNFNNILLLNDEFSEEELSQIRRLQQQVNSGEVELFRNLYDETKKQADNLIVDNLVFLNDFDSYKKLLSLCKDNPKLLSFAFEKLSEGDILPAQLIPDATEKDLDRLMRVFVDKNKESKERAAKENADAEIIKSDLAIAIGYAREVLAELTGVPAKNQTETTSNDENAFSVKIEGRNIIVDYCLSTASIVSLEIQNLKGTSYRRILNHTSMAKGQQQTVVPVLEEGHYQLTLVVNGRVYTRKIHVNR